MELLTGLWPFQQTAGLDVSVSDDEYREAIQLASALEFDLENLVFNHLKDLRT